MYGSTILDLGDQLDINVGILSIMMFCRAVGAAIGGLGTGFILDMLVSYSYLFMGFSTLSLMSSKFIGDRAVKKNSQLSLFP